MEVKCKDCGFLTGNHFRTRDKVEIETAVRNGGDVPRCHEVDFVTTDLYDMYPLCFKSAFDLKGEARQNSANIKREEKWLQVITQERKCEAFTPWTQGFSPKEHQEALEKERLRKEQDEREAADRKWREEQSEKDHKHRLEQAAEENKWRDEEAKRSQKALDQASHQFKVNLIVMGVLVTLVGVAAQIITALIARGLIIP